MILSAAAAERLRYTALGHHAALLYLNRGQGYRNLEGDRNRCGEIRTAEAHRACEILKARPLFAGQYDGQSVVDTVPSRFPIPSRRYSSSLPLVESRMNHAHFYDPHQAP